MSQNNLDLGIPPLWRTQSEVDRDLKYAKYWLDEYGSVPDAIRINYIFPEIQRLAAKYALDGHVYDFGCGAGSAVQEVRGWRAQRYLGIDVNEKFIEVAKSEYGDAHTSFVRRNFEQSGWHEGLTRGFDLGISLFVWNELRNPKPYLRGMKQLCKPARRLSEAKRSRLAMVFTHPVMILKDLSDFYFGRTNQRKFDNIESYRSPEAGHYVYTRGDFSIPFQHWPLADVFRLFSEEGWKVESVTEIFYSDGPGESDARNHVSSQFPRFICFILKG